LHGLDSCLEDILEQEGLGELLEVVGLAAESKDISQLLLDLLVALLLANLQQLDDEELNCIFMNLEKLARSPSDFKSPGSTSPY
jgi:hypothetical protein